MANDASGQLSGAASRLADLLLRTGIGGKGAFKSAETIAAQALEQHGDRENAIRWIINSHTRMAAADGFITGVGGFITMVVSIPANIAGFYLVATRMTAAIAKVNGHDLADESVRSAVLLCLAGEDADRLPAGAGTVACHPDGGQQGRDVPDTHRHRQVDTCPSRPRRPSRGRRPRCGSGRRVDPPDREWSPARVPGPAGGAGRVTTAPFA
jgi:hypothetical protein